MSKKLRLDTPSTSSAYLEEVAHYSGTPPTPNTSGGGMFGGGGGMSSSASSSSGGPYRGKYTRGLLGSAASSMSRFNPYSVSSRDRTSGRRSVPLIRAKRDDSGVTVTKSSFRATLPPSGLANTSSTAQRIMEKLANMSTPVLNAGRVRLDSISSIKPLQIGSTLLNSNAVMTPTSKFAGPPKTLSPFSIPKTPVGVKDPIDWSLKFVSGIPPKMVDCWTNTEEAIVTSLAERRICNSISPISRSSPSSALVLSKSRDMWGEKEFVTNGGFNFSSPWSLKEIDDYVGQQIIRSYKRDASNFGAGVASNAKNNGGQKEDVNKPILTNGGTPKTASDINNSFLKLPTTPPIISPKKKWECPSCMVYNNPNESQCVCCGTSKPGPGGSAKAICGDSTDSKPLTWTCDNCYVKNNQSAPACVCCSEPNPSKKESAIPPAAPAKKWECPTCMVVNEPTANECVCCTEKNPNPVVSSEPVKTSVAAPAPVSNFKFGFANSTSAVSTSAPTASTSSSGFTFGATATTTAASSPSNFSFGFKPTSTTSLASVSSTAPSSTSSFSQSSSSVSPIKFGMPSAVSNSTNSSSSTAFDKKSVVESWRCKICSSYKNSHDRHECEVCGSPRPKEFDPDYKIESKPKTELKFEPIFSAKSPSTSGMTSTSSTQNAGSLFQNISSSSGGSVFGSPSTAFGSGSTFAGSGNPLAGASGTGGFGNSSASGSIVFGSSGSNTTNNALSSTSQAVSTTATTSASATPTFGFSSAVTSTSATSPAIASAITSTVASTPTPAVTPSFGTAATQPFTFGTPGSSITSPPKRKSESQNEDSSSKKFSFGAIPQDPSIPSTQTFTFGSTAPQLKMKDPTPASVSTMPLNPTPINNNVNFLEVLKNASAAVSTVKASADKQPTSTGFQFGAPSPAAPAPSSAIFGSAPNVPSNPPAFSFGNSNNAMPSATGAMNPGNLASGIPSTAAAVTPAAPSFSLTPSFNFGAPAPTTPTTFNFGASATNPAAGAAGQPPPLFQFASGNPTPGNIPEGRKIMKATRRFRR